MASGEPLSRFTIELSQTQAETQAERLFVFRSPTRQRIIKLLEKYNDRRLCVFEIAEVLGLVNAFFSNNLQDWVKDGLSKQEDNPWISITNWITKRSQDIRKLQVPYGT